MLAAVGANAGAGVRWLAQSEPSAQGVRQQARMLRAATHVPGLLEARAPPPAEEMVAHFERMHAALDIPRDLLLGLFGDAVSQPEPARTGSLVAVAGRRALFAGGPAGTQLWAQQLAAADAACVLEFAAPLRQPVGRGRGGAGVVDRRRAAVGRGGRAADGAHGRRRRGRVGGLRVLGRAARAADGHGRGSGLRRRACAAHGAGAAGRGRVAAHKRRRGADGRGAVGAARDARGGRVDTRAAAVRPPLRAPAAARVGRRRAGRAGLCGHRRRGRPRRHRRGDACRERQRLRLCAAGTRRAAGSRRADGAAPAAAVGTRHAGRVRHRPFGPAAPRVPLAGIALSAAGDGPALCLALDALGGLAEMRLGGDAPSAARPGPGALPVVPASAESLRTHCRRREEAWERLRTSGAPFERLDLRPAYNELHRAAASAPASASAPFAEGAAPEDQCGKLAESLAAIFAEQTTGNAPDHTRLLDRMWADEAVAPAAESAQPRPKRKARASAAAVRHVQTQPQPLASFSQPQPLVSFSQPPSGSSRPTRGAQRTRQPTLPASASQPQPQPHAKKKKQRRSGF
ncbi:hypothetical protein BX661DRAFT_173737 [Kickxella alabastrina]|uniref:uncharacterized protein n=1 Tax=Kickxella alabastrina TaxID=61397 RepID=UPI00221EF0A6|nr:uncharacterized protein BX661DRAFT_173737 [Kickxella alabastrina]KAI7820100.1 hypothetical protein BX661DRAFT_173737 [Kickxella alabastrina]